MPVLDDKQEIIYISLVRREDVLWKNCEGQWMIGTEGERVKEICGISAT